MTLKKRGQMPATLIITLLSLSGCTNESTNLDQTAVAESTVRLYSENCSICHGISGQGDGKAAVGLINALQPFSNKLTLHERVHTISKGVEQMPPWGAYLTEHQIEQLAIYVSLLGDQS